MSLDISPAMHYFSSDHKQQNTIDLKLVKMRFLTPATKSFNKKDALMKLNFDNLPVVGETKLKKQMKALVFSFHLRGRAAL